MFVKYSIAESDEAAFQVIVFIFEDVVVKVRTVWENPDWPLSLSTWLLQLLLLLARLGVSHTEHFPPVQDIPGYFLHFAVFMAVFTTIIDCEHFPFLVSRLVSSEWVVSYQGNSRGEILITWQHASQPARPHWQYEKPVVPHTRPAHCVWASPAWCYSCAYWTLVSDLSYCSHVSLTDREDFKTELRWESRVYCILYTTHNTYIS